MANAAQLKISQLAALIAVADHGSFSAAALHLNLAQSTISHAIATLETDLGIVLLIRGRTGAVLTPIGSQICQQAKAILTQLDGIRHTAQQAKGLQTGRVRVAAFRTVATHILPEVISRFRRSHPALTVEIDEYDRYAEVEQAIREGRADLGFVLLPTAADFQSWEILRDDFIALLPPLPKTTAKADVPLTWEELVGYSRAANKRSTQNNTLVEEHLARFGYHLPIDYAVREDSTLMSLVTKGLGAAVLARLEAEPIPPGVRVKSLPEPLERVIGVAILENAVLPRAVFVFLDVLLAAPIQAAGKTTFS
ncbi:LysR family transcriptional regulator [cf. Phormidesmis sp. LEGE 11477]|uniref:LysR family transcriptional regulator n=1 Tax=cf. Phormidesmis sp. LEGE 11477 TaxID=1828680 RepID=UPI00187E7F77|nr:LysR family transcriptional regulator [cf. Phormidesmis sp. LEGE 11477]MBE9059413.1 LysR family transcriptional regulator [cf. Phormidesmis sp. LEGE 11477]